MFSVILSVFRHVFGYLVLFPLGVIVTAFQAMVVAPLTGNRHSLPHFVYRCAALLFGIRIVVNPSSAEMVRDRPVMFVANHLSRLDFTALHLFPDAAVMMNAANFSIPLFGPIIRLFTQGAGMVGTRQSHAGKARDLSQLAQAFSQGRNVFLFPEGHPTDGRRVLRYSKGAAEIFYDAELIAEHPEVARGVIQPIVLRVREINGAEVLDNPDQWGGFANSLGRVSLPRGIYHATFTRSVVLDILVCTPLAPKDFDGPKELMDAAFEATRAVVAPGQTTTLTKKEWFARMDRLDYSL